MFRLCIYYGQTDPVVLYTPALPTQKDAEDLLDRLKTEMGLWLTDYQIQQEIPLVGWVVLDDVETVQICLRRNMADR